jgi:uncharacterized protein (DUF362 family)
MVAPVKVAVVRSDNRRGAVAQALALLEPEIRAMITHDALVKPNLVSHRFQHPSTHPETLSAALDALHAAGARDVTVAEGASDASAGFTRFGYRRETWGRPVRFLDLNRDETDWHDLGLSGVDGTTHRARVSRTVCDANCRVSLALAKTHVTSIVTLSLKNMLSSVHPDDRILMHGHAGGNGYSGWKRTVVEFLKGDSLLVRWLTRTMGRAAWAKTRLRGERPAEDVRHLAPKDLAFLKSVTAMNRNLVALNRRVKPHLSVVDAFVGMHREGPRHGTPIRLGTVIAGTDAVAVDAVAAAVMGFDPTEIGYLVLAEAAGLGVADLRGITVVGDPIAAVQRRCVPHSNYPLQRLWRLLDGPPFPAPAPHFSVGSPKGATTQ